MQFAFVALQLTKKLCLKKALCNVILLNIFLHFSGTLITNLKITTLPRYNCVQISVMQNRFYNLHFSLNKSFFFFSSVVLLLQKKSKLLWFRSIFISKSSFILKLLNYFQQIIFKCFLFDNLNNNVYYAYHLVFNPNNGFSQ